MNLFARTRDRFRSGKRQPDYCALVEGLVTQARSTADPKLLLTSVADQIGRALGLPRIVILLNDGEWKCVGEYSATGINATTREKLRRVEAQIPGEMARETTPVQIAVADLKLALRASLEEAIEG